MTSTFDNESVEVDSIIRLAAIIRKVDGNHDKGAAALAEAILSHPDCHKILPTAASQPAPGEGEVGELVAALRNVVTAYKSCYNQDSIWSLSGGVGVNARLTVTLLTRAAALLERCHPAPAEGQAGVVLAEEPPYPNWSESGGCFAHYRRGFCDCWTAARAEVARQQGEVE